VDDGLVWSLGIAGATTIMVRVDVLVFPAVSLAT
jgi:hypothetical protein